MSPVKSRKPCEGEVGEGGPGPPFLVAARPRTTRWSTLTVQPNTAAAQAAEMAGQQLDLLVWGCQRRCPWIWWQGSALSTWGRGSSPLSPPPCCAHPTCSLPVLHPSTTALEKNSSAGAIKDNELLISTEEHNGKHFTSIAFLVELIKIKHKASQLY